MADDITIEVETTDEKVPDADKVILVTQPAETRYTLSQAEQERDMAQNMIAQAKQHLTDAQAKVDEAKKALGQ